jgi:hypothetical protein
MKRNKQMLIGMGIVFPFLCGSAVAQNRVKAGTQPPPANSISLIEPIFFPDSLTELVKLSTFIVTGICEGELPGRFYVKDDPVSSIVTDRLLRVTEVWKGNITPQSQIVIQEPGGTVVINDKRITNTVMHLNPLEPGNRYLLFLLPEIRGQNDSYDGRRFNIVGVWAGSFHLVNGKVKLSDRVQPGLRKLEEQTEAEVLALLKKELSPELQ